MSSHPMSFFGIFHQPPQEISIDPINVVKQLVGKSRALHNIH